MPDNSRPRARARSSYAVLIDRRSSHWRRQPWGTSPVDFQQFVFGVLYFGVAR